MKPKFEQPKQYTPEQIAEMEKSRTISDAELLGGGAEYVVDEKGEKSMETTVEQKQILEVTQIEAVRAEIEAMATQEQKRAIQEVSAETSPETLEERKDQERRTENARDFTAKDLAKNDEELKELKTSIDKWKDSYKSFGRTVETVAKGIQITGSTLGAVGMAGGMLFGTEIPLFAGSTFGGILFNPITIGGVGFIVFSIITGEAMTMYRRHKEETALSRKEERIEEIKQLAKEEYPDRKY